MRSDVPFHSLASKQAGVVSQRQVDELGISQSALYRRARTGELIEVHRGVYRVAGAPDSDLQRLWAAMLAGGDCSAVSRRSAARLSNLHGIWAGPLPEITVPTDWPLDLEGVVVHRSDHLGPRDVVQRADGLRVTSPARTLFDIGVTVGRLAAESACIDALHRGLVTHRDLVDVYARIGGKGRPGSASMRSFLMSSPEGLAAIESELELRFWRIVRDFGLPRPELQHWVTTDGGRFRLDFAYPELKVGMELNGKAGHAGPLARKRDQRRRKLLKAHGWTIYDYGWAAVVQHPERVAAQLGAIFGPADALSAFAEPKLGEGGCGDAGGSAA
jgi:very-short-patch-repair endonuclease